jgi:hypothetical protein
MALSITTLLVISLYTFFDINNSLSWIILLIGLALYYFGGKISMANQFHKHSIFHDVTTMHPKKLFIMLVALTLVVTGCIFVVWFFVLSGPDLIIYLLSIFL